MIIKKKIIPQGTCLYRFVEASPINVKLGMTPNKGKSGRCNLYRDIYYWSKSLEGILLECGSHIQGSIIRSVVLQDIYCGFWADTNLLAKFRDRTKNEAPEMVHDMLLRTLGLDYVTTYDETSKLTEIIISQHPDGVIYPSHHSIDTIINGTIFQIDETTGFSNIALTEQGFSKIKEFAPIVYWH